MSHAILSLPEEMLLGQFIPLHYHYNMLRDESRMLPFQEAIQHAVGIGAKVVELGGGTGVLSYFAAQRAAKVWCVERNPALARAAESFLARNLHGDRVEVVQQDARVFIPPEPVDVVICEMLHVALVREKQLEVLKAFKENYRAAFGGPLPLFIPDATLLGFQLVEQNFSFCGYTAPIPLFQPPGPHNSTRELSRPEVYHTLYYGEDFSTALQAHCEIRVESAGTLNAINFLTNNFLAFVLHEKRAIQWPMNQLVLPLPEPVAVQADDIVEISLIYSSGCPIESLCESLEVRKQNRRLKLRRAA